jgi:hypothetical protein
MISGGGFRRHLFAVPLAELPAQLGHFLHLLASNFLGLGVLLGVIGAVSGWRRAGWLHAALTVMLVGHLGFFLLYGAGDRDVMHVPALLIWAIWIGLGTAACADWITARAGATSGPLAAGLLLASLVALLLLVNAPLVDLSGDRSARERGEAILSALAPDAVFVGAWPDVRLVEYFQQVEGRRGDLQPWDAFFSTREKRAARIAEGLQTGRPVYVTTCRDLPDPALRCEYDPVCECHLLLPASPY